MTQELFEKCKPFEEKLHTALYCDFVRLTDSHMKEQLAQLHTEEFGHGGNILGGCNRCVLNAIKNLAKSYFQFKAKAEAEEKVGKELELNTQVFDSQPIKKVQPKKATNKTKKTTKK